jgi:hypothetical protein
VIDLFSNVPEPSPEENVYEEHISTKKIEKGLLY